MALTKTVLYRIRKTSNSKAELECRQELIPNPRDPDNPIYSVLLTITNNQRSFSCRICDEIEELIERSKYVINDQSIDIWDAHQFLNKYIGDRSQLSATDIIYNIISSNPIPDTEAMYHQLKAYSIDPERCNVQSDKLDEIDMILFNNATYVCKYMRKLAYISGSFHKLTDSILVFENVNTSSEETGRGQADICWTDTTLQIMYRPYFKEGVQAAEPWKISFKVHISHTGKNASSKPPKEYVTEIRVSNEDYVNFVDTICNALEQYKLAQIK